MGLPDIWSWSDLCSICILGCPQHKLLYRQLISPWCQWWKHSAKSWYVIQENKRYYGLSWRRRQFRKRHRPKLKKLRACKSLQIKLPLVLGQVSCNLWIHYFPWRHTWIPEATSFIFVSRELVVKTLFSRELSRDNGSSDLWNKSGIHSFPYKQVFDFYQVILNSKEIFSSLYNVPLVSKFSILFSIHFSLYLQREFL